MSSDVVTVMHSKKAANEALRQREELVHRVASSITFEKAPRLRAFFLHVCRCALENKSEEATEQQIGIYVYGRQPSYNPNDDNIVRSQARMLRMKLEHHFANEGKDEPVVITIPKGQYLPIFEARTEEPPAQPRVLVLPERKSRGIRPVVAVAAVLTGVVVLLLCSLWFVWRHSHAPSPSGVVPTGTTSQPAQEAAKAQRTSPRVAVVPDGGDIRIAAGRTGDAFVDMWGRRWEPDRYYTGGVSKAGPARLFPPVPDEGLFKSIRQAASFDQMVPQPEREFQYNIPVSPGVYELRLYFADPLRMPDTDQKEDAQNVRHLAIDLNGRPLLANFDPVADGGSSAVDVRVFKDVRPAEDGYLHLQFVGKKSRAFVNAIELVPGQPGKLLPIRFLARATVRNFCR